MWSLLGPRGVDCLAWESFGHAWLADAVEELKLADVRPLTADYGELPDLGAVDPARDCVFAWNGTTSGVRVPDGSWIADDRSGLTLCDATSAVFAMRLPWPKLDVVTFSWQKVLGGEAQHGMLVLSPRALERLISYRPSWPIPKVLRLTKGGRLNDDIFSGGATNTPSLLCVEDYLDALRWSEEVGGLEGLIARCERNHEALMRWVDATPWVEPLASRPEIRSTTSVCLKVIDPWFVGLPLEGRWAFIKRLTRLLEGEGVAYDIAAYRDAPPGLRIWCGATVEVADIEALTPWLEWAYRELRSRSAPESPT